MKIFKNIKYSVNEDCLLDIYVPNTDSFSLFIYFHGGGLESGDKEEARVLAEYLIEKNVAVVSANYRMYPKAEYPDYIIDAAECVSWVFSNISQYGKCNSIYVGGSSAGAYISMMLCFDKKYLSSQGVPSTQIAGYIHDAGQPTSHYNVLREKGIDTRRVIVDETAPLYYVGAEEEYPNMSLILSDNDLPNRYEQTLLLQSTLKHFGHSVDIKVLQGEHSQYVQRMKEGKSELGETIYSCISKWEDNSYLND